MNKIRIKAILIQEFYFSYQSVEIIMDLVVFPLMSIVVFGFLSKYLAGINNPTIGKSVLLSMLLWQVIWITQYTITLGSLWNIWSKNLSNLFVTPLSVGEYIFAQTLSGVVKGLVILLFSAIISVFVFNFNILEIGFMNLILILINLVLFAFSLGIAILGFIFRFGVRIQAFAWGILPFFQPLTAAFYPVSVLPESLQTISYLLSPTYMFELTRSLLNGYPADMRLFGIAFIQNILYLIVAIALFKHNFEKSRESGQFARNEA